jgi:hypothetical protein
MALAVTAWGKDATIKYIGFEVLTAVVTKSLFVGYKAT